MGASGETTIDFGATPTQEANIAITGQGSILAASLAEAWIMGAITTDNNENAHLFGGVSMKCTCGIPTAGTGFTIYATCIAGAASGQFKLKWVWN